MILWEGLLLWLGTQRLVTVVICFMIIRNQSIKSFCRKIERKTVEKRDSFPAFLLFYIIIYKIPLWFWLTKRLDFEKQGHFFLTLFSFKRLNRLIKKKKMADCSPIMKTYNHHTHCKENKNNKGNLLFFMTAYKFKVNQNDTSSVSGPCELLSVML